MLPLDPRLQRPAWKINGRTGSQKPLRAHLSSQQPRTVKLIPLLDPDWAKRNITLKLFLALFQKTWRFKEAFSITLIKFKYFVRNYFICNRFLLVSNRDFSPLIMSSAIIFSHCVCMPPCTKPVLYRDRFVDVPTNQSLCLFHDWLPCHIYFLPDWPIPPNSHGPPFSVVRPLLFLHTTLRCGRSSHTQRKISLARSRKVENILFIVSIV